MKLLPGGRRLLLFIVPPAVAAALAAGLLVFHPSLLARPASAPAAAAARAGADLAAGPAQPSLLIHVTGAVVHPGVYRLKRGQRVADAISAAGGLAAAADRGRLPDLAGILRDGEQVRVPTASSRPGSTRASALDLNTATEAELAAVPGFTPALARATIQYRSLFGGFTSVRELLNGVGMDPAAFARARPHLRV